jgi:hypothetical protein
MRGSACLLGLLLQAAVFTAGCGEAASPGQPPVFGAQPAAVVTSAPGGLKVTVWTAPSPPVKGINAVRLLVEDPAGAGVEGAGIHAMAWMPAHGHGTAVEPAVTEEGAGVYALERVVFHMEGRWELHGDATLGTSATAPAVDSFVTTFDVR